MEYIGSHCSQILDDNGKYILNPPVDWKGIPVKQTVVPGEAECGPQYTGFPVLSVGLTGVGRRWYRSGGKTIELQSGAPKFDIYGGQYERDYGRWEGESGESICLTLPPSLIERYLHEDAYHFDLKTSYENIDTSLREMVLLYAKEIRFGFCNGPLFAEGLSLSILGWLNHHYRLKTKRQPKPKNLSNTYKVRLTEYIDNFLHTDLTIEHLAAVIHVSPSYFSPLFKQTFKVPPHQYVLQRRIEKAALLLRTEKDLTIADIAIMAGFASQAHMTYAFKRYLKHTPAKWRSG